MAISKDKEPKVESLPVSSIRLDGKTQAREKLNEAVVDQYAEEMKGGAQFPPLVAYYDGSDYWLAAGFHRYHACLRAGVERIKVEVRFGAAREARYFAIGDNADHGLQRTNGDKRKAVGMLLADPEWSGMSLRELAKAARVGKDLVLAVKAEFEAPVVPTGKPGRVTGADGKSYQESRKASDGSEASPVEDPGSDAEFEAGPAEGEPLAPPDPQKHQPRVAPATPGHAKSAYTSDGKRLVVDRYDVPVPDELVPVFDHRETIEQVRKDVAKAAKSARDLFDRIGRACASTQPGVERFDVKTLLHKVREHAAEWDAVEQTLRIGVAHCVCPACDGYPEKKGCAAKGKDAYCGGKGWIDAGRYQSLPNAARARCERFVRSKVS